MKRRARAALAPPGGHTPDGSDDRGKGLPITIRIAPDGRIYFHDITEDLVPVALAVCPEDSAMRRRMLALKAFGEKEAL
jgi:hypothetical protein